ncbi:MAG: hypothetical protein K2X91_10545, partial [Thermoleophilia bacterium]|nr:hypothetical protein [Thermoleophilia bacterium]
PARFAVCLGDGRGPGADLTQRVAAALGATPVVTVAEGPPPDWAAAGARIATADTAGRRS